MRTIALTVALAVLASVGWAGLIFQDNFSNNVVTDSDGVAGFWTQRLNPGGGDANAIVEAGGILTMTCGSNDGTSDSDYAGVKLFSAFSSNYSWFAQARVFKVRGITFNDHGTGISDSSEQLRFCLVSSDNNSYSADDAIVVKVSPNGKVRLGKKENAPNNNSDGGLIREFSGLGVSGTYGFDLMLRQINSTTLEYEFKVYTGAVPVSAGVKVGSFTLAEADWGTGDTRICFVSQEYQVTGGNQYYDATVSSIEVWHDENLLYNAGFELGNTTGWIQFGGATLSLESSTVRTGSFAGRASGRNEPYKSIGPDVMSVMSNGVTYTVSMWARLASGSGAGLLKIKERVDGVNSYSTIASGTLTDNAWTLLEG